MSGDDADSDVSFSLDHRLHIKLLQGFGKELDNWEGEDSSRTKNEIDGDDLYNDLYSAVDAERVDEGLSPSKRQIF